jgi:hypothetical protein
MTKFDNMHISCLLLTDKTKNADTDKWDPSAVSLYVEGTLGELSPRLSVERSSMGDWTLVPYVAHKRGDLETRGGIYYVGRNQGIVGGFAGSTLSKDGWTASLDGYVDSGYVNREFGTRGCLSRSTDKLYLSLGGDTGGDLTNYMLNSVQGFKNRNGPGVFNWVTYDNKTGKFTGDFVIAPLGITYKDEVYDFHARVRTHNAMTGVGAISDANVPWAACKAKAAEVGKPALQFKWSHDDSGTDVLAIGYIRTAAQGWVGAGTSRSKTGVWHAIGEAQVPYGPLEARVLVDKDLKTGETQTSAYTCVSAKF